MGTLRQLLRVSSRNPMGDGKVWVSSENSYVRKRFGVCVRSGPNDSAKASEAEGDALGHLNMLRKYTSCSRPAKGANLALKTASSIAKDDLDSFWDAAICWITISPADCDRTVNLA